MFCHGEEKTMRKHKESNVIRALDIAVAFATLETYGVVDARSNPAKRVAEARDRLDGRRARHGHPSGSLGPERACAAARTPGHAGRPRAATAAGRHRHRSALRRIDRLGRPQGAGSRGSGSRA